VRDELVSSVTIVVLLIGAIGAINTQSARYALSQASAAQQALATANNDLSQANASLEARVDERTADLERALADAERIAAEQRDLLDALARQREVIREMSVPVLPLSATTLVMPLVGALDTQRISDIQSQALAAVERSGAQHLLLDVTGLAVIDSQVAAGLVRTAKAVRLLGAWVTLVGVRPEVAQAIVGLGIELHELRTASDLGSALATLR
jgi:rsbT co-antagonist protein RsbR